MFRNALLMLAFSCWLSAAQGAQGYICTLLDGSEYVGRQNLAAQFPSAIGECEELAEESSLAPADPQEHGLTVIVQKSAAKESDPNEKLASLILAASRRNNLDPRLVNAIVAVESGHVSSARSPKGALGLMQIMPATGARFGAPSEDALLDPAINIEIGTRYLAELHRRYFGRVDLVLAAYNAGQGAVARHGNQVPPYPETTDYISKILMLYGKN